MKFILLANFTYRYTVLVTYRKLTVLVQTLELGEVVGDPRCVAALLEPALKLAPPGVDGGRDGADADGAGAERVQAGGGGRTQGEEQQQRQREVSPRVHGCGDDQTIDVAVMLVLDGRQSHDDWKTDRTLTGRHPHKTKQNIRLFVYVGARKKGCQIAVACKISDHATTIQSQKSCRNVVTHGQFSALMQSVTIRRRMANLPSLSFARNSKMLRPEERTKASCNCHLEFGPPRHT